MNTRTLKAVLAGGIAMAAQGPAAQEPASGEPTARERSVQESLARESVVEEKVAPEPVIPLIEPPQDLIGEDGKVELDLVDPFQRGTVEAVEEEEPEELSSTTLGEISEEFRILAIVIPEGPSREPMALIRMQDESSPQVVRKDDLVRIKRRPPDRRAPFRMRASGNASPEQQSFEESALNALESYSFYLHIKEIKPTYIEAYQKKSPNETIILRW